MSKKNIKKNLLSKVTKKLKKNKSIIIIKETKRLSYNTLSL